jgi:hypothetical protein
MSDETHTSLLLLMKSLITQLEQNKPEIKVSLFQSFAVLRVEFHLALTFILPYFIIIAKFKLTESVP